MVRIVRRPIHQQIAPRIRAKITDQARQAKMQTSFPALPPKGIHQEIIDRTIITFRSLGPKRGYSLPSVLLNVAGGAGGFVAGAAFGFQGLKEMVAMRRSIPVEELTILDFVAQPTWSVEYVTLHLWGLLGAAVGLGAAKGATDWINSLGSDQQ